MILRPGMGITQANAKPVRAAIDALVAYICIAAAMVCDPPREARRMRLGDGRGDVGKMGSVA